jgi:hypothetical protein
VYLRFSFTDKINSFSYIYALLPQAEDYLCSSAKNYYNLPSVLPAVMLIEPVIV